MSIKFYRIRFMRYLKENGFKNTIRRIYEKSLLYLFKKKDFVFYCDLTLFDITEMKNPNNIKIESKLNEKQIGKQDFYSLIEYSGEEIVRAWLKQRFAQSAILWMIKVDDQLAGYVWSIGRSRVESLNPYYFPLCDNDVFMFDGATLPQYRGRDLYPLLHKNVLCKLKALGFIRAVFETHEWNFAIQKSVAKVGMNKLGVVRKYKFGGRNFLVWEKETLP